MTRFSLMKSPNQKFSNFVCKWSATTELHKYGSKIHLVWGSTGSVVLIHGVIYVTLNEYR